jgi:hydroxyacylglutathione hydrolase
MIFQRIKAEGIAHNSYFLGSGNEAVVVDPRRDCQVYVDLARQAGLKIKYILETHRHEDFVVGSFELEKITGAEVYHGPGLEWKYGTTLKDDQSFQIGRLGLTAIYTPGHTDESVSFALSDFSTGKTPVLLFTGDTLFVGDVGRTDLYGHKEEKRLASSLYDSLFNRLMPLGDGVIIYPAHGGGSVCGIHIANRDESTIGLEKEQNALLKMTKDEFIKRKLTEKPERPFYFTQMEKYNLEGPPLLGFMPLPAQLSADQFKKEIEKGSIVVDTREPAAFGGIHINGTYSIWLEGMPEFAGWVLPHDKPILLVLENESQAEKAVQFLIRLGYDRISGYLKGGIESWYNAGFSLEQLGLLSVHQLKNMLDQHERITVLDTRTIEEWESGHIENAIHMYVGHLEERLPEIPNDKPIAVYCKNGHRASLGASILLRTGYTRVYNVPGSILAWRAAGYPLTSR